MKQRVSIALTVEFPDDVPQVDVDEALVDALQGIHRVLKLLPSVKGASKSKKLVVFKIVDIEKG